MKKLNNKIKCACCNNLIIDSVSDICPFCFWQRDL